MYWSSWFSGSVFRTVFVSGLWKSNLGVISPLQLMSQAVRRSHEFQHRLKLSRSSLIYSNLCVCVCVRSHTDLLSFASSAAARAAPAHACRVSASEITHSLISFYLNMFPSLSESVWLSCANNHTLYTCLAFIHVPVWILRTCSGILD